MTVNSQVVIMFLVVQEQGHTVCICHCMLVKSHTNMVHALDSVHFCLHADVYEMHALYTVDIESPRLFWCQVSAFRLLSSPV